MTGIVIAHATTGCYGHKNALQRTAANCTGALFVTRYASSKKVHSSKQSSTGNLAGKTRAGF
jgi:hypothetical protein